MSTFEDSIWGRTNTKAVYTSLFRKWIEPNLQSPETASNTEMVRLIKLWDSRGLAPRTIKSLITLTSQYVEWSGGTKIHTTPLVRGVLRAQQEKPIKSLTTQEASALIKEIKDTDLHLPVLLGVHAGLRRGEVFGLRGQCVDLIKGELCICRSYSGPTKSGKTRKVPVSAELEQALFAQISKNADNCLRNPVIESQFDPNPRLKAACRRARIPVISFHGLRHTFATLALEAGRSPKLVQQALGHSKVSTTVDLYWQAREQLDINFLPKGE